MDQNEALNAEQFRNVRDAVWACRSFIDPKTGKRIKVTPTQKLIALRLVEHWPRIFPSVRTICWWTGLSDRGVQKALRKLEMAGIVRTTRRVGKSSSYEFPGVSIPRLGLGAGLPPPPEAPGGEPGSEGGGEPGSLPLGNAVPPKPQGLSLNKGEGDRARRRFGAKAPPGLEPPVWWHLLDWEPSPELATTLIARARELGLSDAVFTRRLKALRIRPIPDGTLDRDAYVSLALERWGEWAAEDKRAVSSGGTGSNFTFQAPDGSPPRPRVPGLPAWVYERHKKIADDHGIDLKQAAIAYAKQATQPPSSLRPCDVFAPFEAFLLKLAQREHDHAAE
jgi:hypothetical protein